MEDRFSDIEIGKFKVYEFDPLYALFNGNEVVEKKADNNDQLNYLYDTLRNINLVKANCEFFYSYLKFSKRPYLELNESSYPDGKFAQSEVLSSEDFEAMLADLIDMVFIVESDISILENASGEKYWKKINLDKPKKERKTKSRERLITQREQAFLYNHAIGILFDCSMEAWRNNMAGVTNLQPDTNIFSDISPSKQEDRNANVEALKSLEEKIGKLHASINKTLKNYPLK